MSSSGSFVKCVGATPTYTTYVCGNTSTSSNSSVEELRKKILNGTIQEELKVDVSCSCDQVMGETCGNKRGSLYECRCEALDRKKDPSLRAKHETLAIDTIEKLLTSKNSSQLNLALFGTGGLHGELVLLVRLIDRLTQLKFKGCINLSLMDTCYQTAIKLTDQGKTPCYTKSMAQFMLELASFLPPTIQVNTTFYGDAGHYVAHVKNESSCKNDLLLAADAEDTMSILKELQEKTNRTGLQALILGKRVQENEEIPQMCSIDTQISCYDLRPSVLKNFVQEERKEKAEKLVLTTNTTTRKKKNNSTKRTSTPLQERNISVKTKTETDNTIPIAIGIGSGLLLLLIIGIVYSRRSRSN